MKKLLFGLALILASFVSAQTQKAAPKAAGPQIYTYYEAGAFSAGVFGCWGNSVCRKQIVLKTSNPVKPTTLVINNEDGTVTIKFDYNSFNDKNKEYYSNREVFLMDEEFEFNAEECMNLKLKEGTKLKTGEYKIVRENNILTIKVNI